MTSVTMTRPPKNLSPELNSMCNRCPNTSKLLSFVNTKPGQTHTFFNEFVTKITADSAWMTENPEATQLILKKARKACLKTNIPFPSAKVRINHLKLFSGFIQSAPKPVPDLRIMLEDGTHVDVNKSQLLRYSKFFVSFLEDAIKNNALHRGEDGFLILPNLQENRPLAFKYLMHCMSHATLPSIPSVALCKEILELVSPYGISRCIKKEIEVFIANKVLNPETALQLYYLSRLYDLKELQMFSRSSLLKLENLFDVYESVRIWAQINDKDCKEILSAIPIKNLTIERLVVNLPDSYEDLKTQIQKDSTFLSINVEGLCRLSETQLESILSSLSSTTQNLNLSNCKFVQLPSLAHLSKLMTLNLTNCQNLTSITSNQFGSKLITLILDGCTSLKEIDNSIVESFKSIDIHNCPNLSIQTKNLLAERAIQGKIILTFDEEFKELLISKEPTLGLPPKQSNVNRDKNCYSVYVNISALSTKKWRIIKTIHAD